MELKINIKCFQIFFLAIPSVGGAQSCSKHIDNNCFFFKEYISLKKFIVLTGDEQNYRNTIDACSKHIKATLWVHVPWLLFHPLNILRICHDLRSDYSATQMMTSVLSCESSSGVQRFPMSWVHILQATVSYLECCSWTSGLNKKRITKHQWEKVTKNYC